MTIKSHFNRSTTTKTVSWVPVSFEISIWKSRLKETRHFFFFLGIDCFILKKKKTTHTHYIIFHKTYDGDISWQLRVLSEWRAVAYESCRCAPSDFACPRASHCVNWLRLSDTNSRHKTLSSLVQIMACDLVGAKLLSQSLMIICQLDF